MEIIGFMEKRLTENPGYKIDQNFYTVENTREEDVTTDDEQDEQEGVVPAGQQDDIASDDEDEQEGVVPAGPEEDIATDDEDNAMDIRKQTPSPPVSTDSQEMSVDSSNKQNQAV